MNRPTYDPDSIARDAAAVLALIPHEAAPTDAEALAASIKLALELHRLAWEACLPLNRPAPSQTHGLGLFDPIVGALGRMEQELRDLGVRPVTREDDDGAYAPL